MSIYLFIIIIIITITITIIIIVINLVNSKYSKRYELKVEFFFFLGFSSSTCYRTEDNI